MNIETLELGGSHAQLEVPEYVFTTTDPWGRTYYAALEKLDWRGKRVCELGTGSGAGAIIALRRGAQHVVANDIDSRVLEVARRNIDACCRDELAGSAQAQMQNHDGIRLLAEWTGDPFDIVIGCIPQAWGTPEDLVANPDGIAHLYDAKTYPALREWGMGLVYAATEQTRRCLRPEGQLALVNSGRVPKSVRHQMYADLGFLEPRVLERRMVRQHTGTPLGHLAGHTEALLFDAENGERVLTPEEAERRRVQALKSGEPLQVFHALEVIQTSLI